MQRVIMLTLVVCAAAPSMAQSISFTGNVPSDFAAGIYFVDQQNDVGVPGNFPAGTISGWDLDGVAVSYDAVSDTLFVGFDSRGIFGDADGDGDPSGSSPALVFNGGIDRPDLGGSESVTFSLDLNNDGNPDVLAGVGLAQDITSFRVATFLGSIFAPYAAFGAPLPAHTGSVFMSPSAGAPDLEFTITNFAALVALYAAPGQTNIGFHAFAGSLDDDGVGEDFLPGTGTLLLIPNPVNAKLGGRLFVDGNCDGLLAMGDLPIGGQTVELYSAMNLGLVVGSALTDPNGAYTFCVAPGSYVVRFPLVSGHYFAPANVGTDPTIDSDIGQGGFSAVVTVGPSATRLDLDGGYCVCTGVMASITPLGAGCGVGDPVFTVDHAPFLGSDVHVTVTSMLPNAAVFPFFSFGPVAPVGVTGSTCMIYVDVLNMPNLYELPLDSTDGTGTWTLDWSIPSDPSLIGVQIVAQIRLCSPSGPAGPLAPLGDWLSNGILFTLGCP